MLGVVSGGYGGFASSPLWIGVIMDYADVLLEGKSASMLPAELEAVTELDPHWLYPFEFAGLVLDDGVASHQAAAVRLLGKGIERFPDSWRLRVYLAVLMSQRGIGSAEELARILLPVASDPKAPQYARTLAFTLLHKSGRPEEAMSLLLQTYAQVPDPMVRLQFRGKIGDMLSRNGVAMGTDSVFFLDGIGALLDSKDPKDHAVAQGILAGLIDVSRREAALGAARQIAEQYRSYQNTASAR